MALVEILWKHSTKWSKNDLEKLSNSERNNKKANYRSGYLNINECQALNKYKFNQDLVIRSVDKGDGIVLQDYSQYYTQALKILSDTDYYVIVPSDPFVQIQSEI